MFAQGKTIQRIKQSIHRKRDIQLAQPQDLNYPKIRSQLMAATQSIREQNKRQTSILRQKQKHRSYQLQLRKVMSLTPYRYDSVLTPDSLDYRTLLSLSCTPFLDKFSFDMLNNLIQMQDQIDPFTKQLVKLPGKNMPIHQFVTQCITQTSSLTLFNKLLSSFGILDGQRKKNLLSQLLNKANNLLQYFGYIIESQDARIIFFYSAYQHPITKKQMAQTHKRAISKCLQNMDFLTPGFDSLISYATQMLLIKRMSYIHRDNSFFAVLKPQQIEKKDKIIKDSLNAQNEHIQQGFQQIKRQKRQAIQYQRQYNRQIQKLRIQGIIQQMRD